MQANLFFAAAAASALTFLVHTFPGGRFIGAPLSRSELPEHVRVVGYFCWHLVTLQLALMCAGFVVAGVTGELNLARIMTAFAISAFLLNIGLTLRYRVTLKKWLRWFVAGPLFFAVSALGVAGLLARS